MLLANNHLSKLNNVISFIIYFSIIFNVSISNANDKFLSESEIEKFQDLCIKQAKTFVTLQYNFNELEIKKHSSFDISEICNDYDVAGCFKESNTWNSKTNLETINIGKYICQIPQVEININYNKSYIHLIDEGSCQLRALFRHELQHFYIWKFVQNRYFEDLNETITQKAKDKVCLKNINCPSDNDIYDEINLSLHNIYNKWNMIKEEKQKMLDSIDHNKNTAVNYVVCHKKNYFLKAYK